jgi:predicted Zn-dependent peptidase
VRRRWLESIRNAVVAIVGDLDVERIEGWAHAYFGSIPAGDAPPPVTAREPVQRGERRIEVEFEAEPALRIGWHVPDIFHDDMPALAMLSSVLTGGRTSRLHRRLVLEERSAAAVYTSMGPGSLYPQLFQVDAVPRAPHTSLEVESAIYAEIQRIKESPPEPGELYRVLSQIEASDVRRLQSNLGLAFQLADSESLFGDWSETFRLSHRLRDVTPEDVQRVARLYLTASNRTVAHLVRPAPRPQ